VVTVTAPQRLLANWDAKAHGWRLDGGAYKLMVGPDAATATLTGSAQVAAGSLRP
jgi:beta-glucosidase